MTGPIPKSAHSTYEAHGAAMAAWQMVETALYYLVHAVLKTDEALSSTIFFHIRSPSAKVSLAADLLRQSITSKSTSDPWKSIHKRLTEAADVRNHLAHFEMMGIILQSRTTKKLVLDPQLSEPFHDIRTHQKPSVKVYDKAALERVTSDYIALANDLLNFATVIFGQTLLPQELVRKGREQSLHLPGNKGRRRQRN